MTNNYDDLDKRISQIEKSLKTKEKPPKAPRKPSAYNNFMKDYCSKHKDPKKPHKELFEEAAKEWSKQKK